MGAGASQQARIDWCASTRSAGSPLTAVWLQDAHISSTARGLMTTSGDGLNYLFLMSGLQYTCLLKSPITICVQQEHHQHTKFSPDAHWLFCHLPNSARYHPLAGPIFSLKTVMPINPEPSVLRLWANMHRDTHLWLNLHFYPPVTLQKDHSRQSGSANTKRLPLSQDLGARKVTSQHTVEGLNSKHWECSPPYQTTKESSGNTAKSRLLLSPKKAQ